VWFQLTEIAKKLPHRRDCAKDGLGGEFEMKQLGEYWPFVLTMILGAVLVSRAILP
jgi:hypothetical protein